MRTYVGVAAELRAERVVAHAVEERGVPGDVACGLAQERLTLVPDLVWSDVSIRKRCFYCQAAWAV